jgi:hypothetical protein
MLLYICSLLRASEEREVRVKSKVPAKSRREKKNEKLATSRMIKPGSPQILAFLFSPSF